MCGSGGDGSGMSEEIMLQLTVSDFRSLKDFGSLGLGRIWLIN